MWILLGTVITTSFFDSLNPSAIAEQMLLQAMVKNKRHIWFFILGIGTANLALGLAIYYGIATWVSKLLSKAIELYPWYVYGAALGAGVLCLLIGIRLIVKTKLNTKNNSEKTSELKNPARLSPLSLFFLGAGFCAVELTSAFAYFGFLAILTTYNLIFPLVLVFTIIYNFMYILPLILIYFAYNKLQGTSVIKKIESILSKIAAYVVPVVVTLLGIFTLLRDMFVSLKENKEYICNYQLFSNL